MSDFCPAVQLSAPGSQLPTLPNRKSRIPVSRVFIANNFNVRRWDVIMCKRRRSNFRDQRSEIRKDGPAGGLDRVAGVRGWIGSRVRGPRIERQGARRGWGIGYRVSGVGCGVWGVGCWVSGLGSGVRGLGYPLFGKVCEWRGVRAVAPQELQTADAPLRLRSGQVLRLGSGSAQEDGHPQFLSSGHPESVGGPPSGWGYWPGSFTCRSFASGPIGCWRIRSIAGSMKNPWTMPVFSATKVPLSTYSK